jgi:hypothetical protein
LIAENPTSKLTSVWKFMLLFQWQVSIEILLAENSTFKLTWDWMLVFHFWSQNSLSCATTVQTSQEIVMRGGCTFGTNPSIACQVHTSQQIVMWEGPQSYILSVSHSSLTAHHATWENPSYRFLSNYGESSTQISKQLYKTTVIEKLTMERATCDQIVDNLTQSSKLKSHQNTSHNSYNCCWEQNSAPFFSVLAAIEFLQ